MRHPLRLCHFIMVQSITQYSGLLVFAVLRTQSAGLLINLAGKVVKLSCGDQEKLKHGAGDVSSRGHTTSLYDNVL